MSSGMGAELFNSIKFKNALRGCCSSRHFLCCTFNMHSYFATTVDRLVLTSLSVSSRKVLLKEKKIGQVNISCNDCDRCCLAATHHMHMSVTCTSANFCLSCSISAVSATACCTMRNFHNTLYSMQFNWSVSVWEETVSLAANVQILPLSATEEVVEMW